MTWKDILVCLDSEAGADSRLEFACQAAKRYNCALHGVYHNRNIDTRVYADPGMAMSAWERINADLLEAEDKARQSFLNKTAAAGVTAEWIEDSDLGTRELSRHSHYNDLIIVGQPEPGGSDLGAQAMLMSSGRPTWHVPYTGEAREPKRVLVGWSETREATRAVHDALPLLLKAEHVDVLTIAQGSDSFGKAREASDTLAKHLARHNISVAAHAEIEEDLSVADALLSRASDFGSDTIVIGAYGHSRLREWAFGGATRGLLEHMTVPVFMVH